MLCEPAIFVMLPDTFQSVLKPKNVQRLSVLNDPTVPGVPPVNVAFGRIPSGFACGKNCGNPGSTFRRSLPAFAASSNALVYWCAQFTPTVTSPKSVGLKVCSSVLT